MQVARVLRGLCHFLGPPIQLPNLRTTFLAGTTQTAGWTSAVERTVTGLGYDLVDVERVGGGLLRVTIDRRPGQAYTTGESEFVLVEDCEAVTRQLQYVLEVENADYSRLEVSSPGLDRPLRGERDFRRFVGEQVEITLKQPFQSRKKFVGELREREGGWGLVLPAPAVSKTQAKAGVKVVEQVLDFSLDELQEGRLKPVIDFKGRRRKAEPAAEPTGAGAQSDDGGQEE
jgi:ribosome maturation factor RimP